MRTKEKIIVIGGGFAGLQFIRHLNSSDFEVLLIDRLNHHQFQPLFYQVAAAQIEPASISFPLRKIFQGKRNLQIRMEEAVQIIPEENTLVTTGNRYIYDRLVLATGCSTNFFGLKGVEEQAFTLKSTGEAINIRNSVVRNLETIISSGPEAREALYNIVIAGAGPTGVELAGAFAEMKKNILPKDYPGLDSSRITITIIEGKEYPLSTMSPESQQAALSYLQKLGVRLYMKSFVTDYSNETVTMNSGESIRTASLIWTGGITGNTVHGLDKAGVTKNGRIPVDAHHRVAGYQDIYALGDIALMRTALYPEGHPQVANVAINQGRSLASAINRGTPGPPFEYKDLGSLATIGKFKAVADLPFLKFQGFFAWMFWMFLHLMLILSVKNKIIIFINWVWSFFTNDSSLRLILRDQHRPLQETQE
jgi:NADH dehydrogenase